MNNTVLDYAKFYFDYVDPKSTPVTGNDRVPDEKLRTQDISGLSIPSIPGQGAKL